MTRRALLALAAAMLGTVAFGACQPASEIPHEKVFDLTIPPSREEVGLPDGADVVTQQFDNDFPVQVLLPEGKVLAFDAYLVVVDAHDAADSEISPPTTMDIYHRAASLEDGYDHFLAAAEEFGLDTQAIDNWYREATSPGNETARSLWLRTTIGYLDLEVRAVYLRPPIDDTTVHYLLAWETLPR